MFERPVVYLCDHREPNRREVTDLLVNAPDEEAAKIHAIRVTRGETGTIMVVPANLWEIQNQLLQVLRA